NPRDKATNEQLWHLATQLVQAAARITNYELRIAGLVVSGACSALNQSLMELGATVCTPQSPQCLLCPVRPHCAAHREGRVGELPNLGPRTATTSREFHAFVVNCDGKLPVTQRPSGGVNAGLWEFPNVEVTGGPATPAESLHTLLQLRAHPEPWGEIKHTITRYRITQRVFRVTLSGKRLPERAGLHWLPPAELHRLPFTSAHKRNRLLPGAAAAAGLRDTAALRKISSLGGSVEMRPSSHLRYDFDWPDGPVVLEGKSVSEKTNSWLFAYSRWDLVPVLAGLAHLAYVLALFVLFPQLPWWALALLGFVYSVSISWNINGISHNFLHNPYFRSHFLNRAFSLVESLACGFSQTFYEYVHKRHHVGNSDRQDEKG
ncbi:MAG: hypothetical protein EB034_25165, partial [Verrucomicrobia bacterium]|nr:hypothetical protein [Verrucomicrobiota bacterium]